MPYGILKVDQVTFTNAGVDQTISVSGIVASISGNITATGTISGDVIRGGTLVSGATVTGTAGQFGTITGNTAGFTTVTGTTVTGTTANFVTVSGTTVTGTTAQFTTVTGGTAGFTTITGTTVTGTTANFVTVSGTTVTGNVGNFTTITGGSAGFTTVTGTTITGTTLTVASGTFTGNSTAAAFIPTGSTVPTNGVYLPSANNVAISTNGTNRFQIDSSGNITVDTNTFYVDAANNRVGVGTSAPDVDFHVSNADTARIRLENRDTTGSVAQNVGVIEFEGNDGGAGAAGVRANINAVYEGVDGATALAFGTAADGVSVSEKVRIDRNGRVGIGTTSPIGILNLDRADLSTDTWLRVSQSGTEVFSISQPSTSEIRFATPDLSVDRAFTFYTKGRNAAQIAPAGTFSVDSQTGNAPFIANINSSEVARIDSSGRLLVGTSSARSVGGLTNQVQVEGVNAGTYSQSWVRNVAGAGGATILLGKSRSGSVGGVTIVNNNDQLGGIYWCGADGVDLNTAGASIEAYVDGAPDADDMPSRLVFSTTADGASSPTERMRIANDGQMNHFSSGLHAIRLRSSSSAGTTNTLYSGLHSATQNSTSGTESFIVYTNGNVLNTNNSYGSLSDIKLKENITDATSQWSDIKALQVRKYNFKEETGQETHTQIGLVAQEVELVSPGLVSESPDRDSEGNDLGTVTKSVNYSVLYMKAVKALQEAMERIEQLEAEMAEVKAQLS